MTKIVTADDVEELVNKNPHAPGKEEIAAISDVMMLANMLDNAISICIVIETQLDYFLDDEELRGRRVAALTFWRISSQRIKQRLTNLAGKNWWKVA